MGLGLKLGVTSVTDYGFFFYDFWAAVTGKGACEFTQSGRPPICKSSTTQLYFYAFRGKCW